MTKCCVKGCKSPKNAKDLSFFRLPRNENQKKLWIDRIGTKNLLYAQIMRVCSQHFTADCINRTLGVVRLKDYAVPTLFTFSSSSTKSQHVLSEISENSEDGTALPEPLDIDTVFMKQPQQTKTVMDTTKSKVSAELSDAQHGFRPGRGTTGNLLDLMTHMIPAGDAGLEPDPLNVEVYIQQPPKTETLMDAITCEVLKAQVQKLRRKLLMQHKKIRALGQKCRRLNKKVLTSEAIIADLKKKCTTPQVSASPLEESAGSSEILSRVNSKYKERVVRIAYSRVPVPDRAICTISRLHT